MNKQRRRQVIVALCIAAAAFGMGVLLVATLAPDLGVAISSVSAGVSTTGFDAALGKRLLRRKPTRGGFAVGVITNIAALALVGMMITRHT